MGGLIPRLRPPSRQEQLSGGTMADLNGMAAASARAAVAKVAPRGVGVAPPTRVAVDATEAAMSRLVSKT